MRGGREQGPRRGQARIHHRAADLPEAVRRASLGHGGLLRGERRVVSLAR